MSFSDGLVTLRERHPDGPSPRPANSPQIFRVVRGSCPGAAGERILIPWQCGR